MHAIHACIILPQVLLHHPQTHSHNQGDVLSQLIVPMLDTVYYSSVDHLVDGDAKQHQSTLSCCCHSFLKLKYRGIKDELIQGNGNTTLEQLLQQKHYPEGWVRAGAGLGIAEGECTLEVG